MALYQNINGVWTLAQRPFVRRNGAWVGCEEAWVKRSGTWVRAFGFDTTPPNPPVIDLQIVEDFDTIKGVKTLQSRWIKVGVSLAGASNDPDARLTRVLTTYNGKAPTNHESATYTSGPDNTYPNEPWSEWRYNEFGGHNDTSVPIYKQWPRNPTTGTKIKGDDTYYFTGWALDNSGNWSVATSAQIHVPKDSVDVANVVTKEARFQANGGGSWRTAGYQSGDLIQQKSPRSQGLWFYGNQITDAMGTQGAITVKSAQIRIARRNDTGAANANVYLFWTAYHNVADLPAAAAPGGITKNEITKLGQLAKGQAKWFDLPTAYFNNLNSGIKGLGLDWKDPIKADAL